MADRPLILVTNDDGAHAPGIRFLAEVMSELGEVVMVAPNSAMSGMGHAITIKIPLRMWQNGSGQNYPEYIVEGTPVDCVKLAFGNIVERKPDLLVSGINHGSNASVNVIYSGTMAAAIESALADVPSVGFSILDYAMDADFSHAKEHIKDIASHVLENGLPSGHCLNVNIPVGPVKGVKVCRQAKALWRENFEQRTDPHHRDYYWMRGEFVLLDEGADTDIEALKNGWISLVPIQADLTAHMLLDTFKELNTNAE